MLLGDIKKCENCEAFGCVNRFFVFVLYEPTLDDHDVSSASALDVEDGYGFCPRRAATAAMRHVVDEKSSRSCVGHGAEEMNVKYILHKT
jgi:hypothetical protein